MECHAASLDPRKIDILILLLVHIETARQCQSGNSLPKGLGGALRIDCRRHYLAKDPFGAGDHGEGAFRRPVEPNASRCAFGELGRRFRRCRAEPMIAEPGIHRALAADLAGADLLEDRHNDL